MAHKLSTMWEQFPKLVPMAKAHSSNASSSMPGKLFLDIHELFDQNTTLGKPWLTQHNPEADRKGHLVMFQNWDKGKHLLRAQ